MVDEVTTAGGLREVSGTARWDKLAVAKAAVQGGAPFGTAFATLEEEDDRAALREWFVRTRGVPVHPVAPPAACPTGDCCSRCGSVRMQWAGACKVCLDCGESGGCG